MVVLCYWRKWNCFVLLTVRIVCGNKYSRGILAMVLMVVCPENKLWFDQICYTFLTFFIFHSDFIKFGIMNHRQRAYFVILESNIKLPDSVEPMMTMIGMYKSQQKNHNYFFMSSVYLREWITIIIKSG